MQIQEKLNNKNEVVVVLNHMPWNFGCDYVSQNVKEIAKRTKVVIFNPFYFPTLKNLVVDADKRKEWLASIKIKDIKYFPSVGLLPFQRYKIIFILNNCINWLFFRLYFLLKYGLQKPIFWVFSPQTAQQIKYLRWGQLLVYDRPDHFASVVREDDCRIKSEERVLLKAADFVFTNSPYSLRYVKEYNRNPFLVPWGCADLFILRRKNKLPQDIKPIMHPRLGFIGYINHRVDLKLVYEVALRNMNWQIVLVGPIFDFDPHQTKAVNFYHWMNKAKGLTNIHFLGEKSKDQIGDYISSFDVCLIPYDYSQEFVKGCNPMKFYEYMALGKPVVSVPIEALKNLPPEAVILANTSKEFARGIKYFLNNKSDDMKYIKNRLDIANQNSWEKRVTIIFDILYERK